MKKIDFIKNLNSKYALRLHMSLFLFLISLFSYTLSFSFFHLGMTSLVARYSLVLLSSYLFFFLLIKIWLHYIFPKLSFFSSDDSPIDSGIYDGLDLGSDAPYLSLSPSMPSSYKGEGGGFSGGGASGSWSGPSIDLDEDSAPVVIPLVLVSLMLLLTCSLAIISIYLVVVAPTILGEIAFELALSLGLYKKLKSSISHEGSWKGLAFKKTIWLFSTVFILNLLFTGVASHYYPKAHSFSQLLDSFSKEDVKKAYNSFKENVPNE